VNSWTGVHCRSLAGVFPRHRIESHILRLVQPRASWECSSKPPISPTATPSTPLPRNNSCYQPPGQSNSLMILTLKCPFPTLLALIKFGHFSTKVATPVHLWISSVTHAAKGTSRLSKRFDPANRFSASNKSACKIESSTC